MSVETLVSAIRDLARSLARPMVLMEVCGTHTMAAFRSGLRSLLPDNVRLLSGPGCPVCVTPDAFLEHAVDLAGQPGVLTATFGDMIRVPGPRGSLERARAQGAEVRVVYSPADALALARSRPDREVVFLGVGFETTVPAVAWTVLEAARRGLSNYAVLSAHKTMPAALKALLSGGEVKVDGLLCPGHVSAVIGADAYAFIPRDYGIPCVVAGFEAADLLDAIAMLLRQIRDGRPSVEIPYHRGADRSGNAAALAAIGEVFEPCAAEWRGLGAIPGSGLRLRDAWAAHDAARRRPFTPSGAGRADPACRCGDVLRGAATPEQCPLFAGACTPVAPRGACMVSSEGACAAWYRYGRAAGGRP